MTEPRHPTRIEPEDEGEGRPTPSRRFAQLVESPAARRLALPRLAIAAIVSLAVVGLLGLGAYWAIRTIAGWVDAQPENQLAFSEIRLEPLPPAYHRLGAAGILQSVQREANRAANFSIPSVELEELKTDFRRCPWVENVGQIRKVYRGLEVPLVYRKPVALAAIEKNRWIVIDKDGVILPFDEIDWFEKGPRFRARGIEDPLILLKDFPAPGSERPGLPWKRSDAADMLGDRDLQVLGAARLAEFLQGRHRITPQGKPAPCFLALYSDTERLRYFLRDTEGHSVFWGLAPGAEPLGDLKAEDKWRMLQDWVDSHGPLQTQGHDYLEFTPTGARIHEGLRPPLKPIGKGKSGNPGKSRD